MHQKVLIIDDSDIQRMLSAIIIKKNGFAEEIIDVESADAGLFYLQLLMDSKEKFPSVIFLDINMPGRDGFDFLDEYLLFPEHMREQCKIYMISATNSEEDFIRIETYPVVRQFFNKPLTVNVLKYISSYLDNE